MTEAAGALVCAVCGDEFEHDGPEQYSTCSDECSEAHIGSFEQPKPLHENVAVRPWIPSSGERVLARARVSAHHAIAFLPTRLWRVIVRDDGDEAASLVFEGTAAEVEEWIADKGERARAAWMDARIEAAGSRRNPGPGPAAGPEAIAAYSALMNDFRG